MFIFIEKSVLIEKRSSGLGLLMRLIFLSLQIKTRTRDIKEIEIKNRVIPICNLDSQLFLICFTAHNQHNQP